MGTNKSTVIEQAEYALCADNNFELRCALERAMVERISLIAQCVKRVRAYALALELWRHVYLSFMQKLQLRQECPKSQGMVV